MSGEFALAGAETDAHQGEFGAAFWVKPLPLFIGYLIIAAFCVVFDNIFSFIESLLKDTSYGLIIQRVYRELMIIGISGFIWIIFDEVEVKIDYQRKSAAKFAEITAFVTAFFFKMHGCGLLT
jgi:hypothetical protein